VLNNPATPASSFSARWPLVLRVTRQRTPERDAGERDAQDRVMTLRVRCHTLRALARGILIATAVTSNTFAQRSPQREPSVAARGLFAQPTTSARVHGVVFDSVAQRPLAQALVQLIALDDSNRIRSTRADDAGAYSMDSLPMGRYVLGFLHDRLDTLQLESPLQSVNIRIPGDVRVLLSIPGAATLITNRCGAQPPGQLPTMFLGTVRSAKTSLPVSAARVRAGWNVLLVGPRGIEKRTPAHFVSTNDNGGFAFCGTPTDVAIVARAFAGTDSSGVVELQSPPNGLLVRDLLIGAVAGTPARVRGTVRIAAGAAIAGARLIVWGTSTLATTTNAGQFQAVGLPSGTYTIEARAIGFAPTRVALDLTANAEATINIAMTPLVALTDTVQVRARATSSVVPLADFLRRRARGSGYFLDEQQLKRREVMYVADLFRNAPGITIMQGIYGGDRVLMRTSGGGGACVPGVFLNGLAVQMPDGILDAAVNPQEVRGVEVYSHVASVPIQFQAQNGCGSIVLWTGARGK